MNWEAIGAVGEVIGAIGVIATLGYLSVQIRHNTRAMRAQSVAEVTKSLKSEIDLLAQGHDILSVIIKTQAGEPLDPRELMILDLFMTQAIVSRQNEFLQHQQGLLDDEVLISMQHALVLLLSPPTARNWWVQEGSRMVSAKFARYVEGLLNDGSSIDWWFDRKEGHADA